MQLISFREIDSNEIIQKNPLIFSPNNFIISVCVWYNGLRYNHHNNRSITSFHQKKKHFFFLLNNFKHENIRVSKEVAWTTAFPGCQMNIFCYAINIIKNPCEKKNCYVHT